MTTETLSADHQQHVDPRSATADDRLEDATRQLGVVIVEFDRAAGVAIHTCMPAREAEARLALAQRDGEHLVAFVGVSMPAIAHVSVDLQQLEAGARDRIERAKERLQRDHLVAVALSKYGVPDDPMLRAAVHCAVNDILVEFRMASPAASDSALGSHSRVSLRRVA